MNNRNELDYDILWLDFINNYNPKDKNKNDFLKGYTLLFVDKYLDKLHQKLNQQDDAALITDALNAKHGVAINNKTPTADELDNLQIWNKKGNFDKKKLAAQKKDPNFRITDDRYRHKNIKKGSRIDESASTLDVIKLDAVAALVTVELLNELKLDELLTQCSYYPETLDDGVKLTDIKNYIQDNIASLSLQRAGAVLKMDKSDESKKNKIDPSVNAAINNYKNDIKNDFDIALPSMLTIDNPLEHIQKRLYYPALFMKGLSQFDEFLTQNKNPDATMENPHHQQVVNKMQSDIINNFSETMTVAANKVFRAVDVSSEKSRDKIIRCFDQNKEFVKRSISQKEGDLQKLWTERWIDIADHLTKKGDFFSAQSIVETLTSNDIAKLYLKEKGEMTLSNAALETLAKLQTIYKDEHVLQAHIEQHQGSKIGNIEPILRDIESKEASGISVSKESYQNKLNTLYVSIPPNSLHETRSVSDAMYNDKAINTAVNEQKKLRDEEKKVRIEEMKIRNAVESAKPEAETNIKNKSITLPPLPGQNAKDTKLNTASIMIGLSRNKAKEQLTDQLSQRTKSSNTIQVEKPKKEPNVLSAISSMFKGQKREQPIKQEKAPNIEVGAVSPRRK